MEGTRKDLDSKELIRNLEELKEAIGRYLEKNMVMILRETLEE